MCGEGNNSMCGDGNNVEAVNHCFTIGPKGLFSDIVIR